MVVVVGASNNNPAQGLHTLKSGPVYSRDCRLSTGLDDCVRVSSSYAGDFSVSRLDDVHQLVLFAAGTGFTPIASLIAYCYSEAANSSSARSVLQAVSINQSINQGFL